MDEPDNCLIFPIAETNRFLIFAFEVILDQETGEARDIFQAWGKQEPTDRPLCEVTAYGRIVFWIHVDECHRRQGIATEVITELTELMGDLTISNPNQAGKEFWNSVSRCLPMSRIVSPKSPPDPNVSRCLPMSDHVSLN